MRAKSRRRLGEAPQPVIRRWWQRYMHKQGMKLVRFIMRRFLYLKERERRRALNEAFEVARHYAFKNENGRFQGYSTLLNMGFYLLIAERDIQALKIDALTHPDEWTRKLHARIILLTIYEWDAAKISGQRLRHALDVMKISEDAKHDLYQVLKELRIIQRKIQQRFKFVRNTVIAHRDADALAQYRAIRNLNVEEVFKFSGEFYVAMSKFMAISTKVMSASVSLESMLGQWADSEAPKKA